MFTQLKDGSALGVDPVTGEVFSSANYLTATNATDVLLISAGGFQVPSSRLQSHGLGHWSVTHSPDVCRLTFLGRTNGHAALLVTANTEVTFILQATDNLANAQWGPIATNRTSGGMATVVDPQAT